MGGDGTGWEGVRVKELKTNRIFSAAAENRISLQEKLYGSREELEMTTHFISILGLQV